MNDTDPAARALARVLNLTDQKKLPSVPWEGWCQESGIESPELARTFLNELATLYYKKSEAALPKDVMQEGAKRSLRVLDLEGDARFSSRAARHERARV